MTSQMQGDLETLRESFEAARWRPGAEPIIGSPDCSVLTEEYGERGRSCYVIFVYKKSDGAYGCRHERCFRDGDGGGPSFGSPEEAIHHQRRQHFY
jgi:hypothetical protein